MEDDFSLLDELGINLLLHSNMMVDCSFYNSRFKTIFMEIEIVLIRFGASPLIIIVIIASTSQDQSSIRNKCGTSIKRAEEEDKRRKKSKKNIKHKE